MKCRKCHKEIAEDSKFCQFCGSAQVAEQKHKARGNGTGSVYKRGNTWKCVKTIRYTVDHAGKLHRETISKGGFRTKKEALEALATLTDKAERKKCLTLRDVYDAWEPTHQAGASTMECYAAAFKWMGSLHGVRFQDLDIDDLQEVVDDCPNGKRTKQNMKALCGLLYKYAIPRNMATLNLGQYIRIHAEDAEERAALPMETVQKLMENRERIPYAEHIICQCYLGFRPSELLALDAINYNRTERCFKGGAKTDAGRDRLVTISPKIQPIIDQLIRDRVSGQVFRREDGGILDIKAYRTAFYKALDAVGLDNPVTDGRHKYTPHSCRHTFATMLKNVKGSDKDKLSLIGHTSTAMLRHYQEADLESLRRITDAI